MIDFTGPTCPDLNYYRVVPRYYEFAYLSCGWKNCNGYWMARYWRTYGLTMELREQLYDLRNDLYCLLYINLLLEWIGIGAPPLVQNHTTLLTVFGDCDASLPRYL